MRATGTAAAMVGRSRELRTLLEALDDGRRGRPRTLLVRGEAGIGKTRLVQEVLVQAAVRRDEDLPLAIAVGQCVDLGPIGAPFGPVRRVLRDLHAEVGTDALRAAAGSPAVVGALAALVPGISDDPASDDDHVGEFAEAIEAVFENLSTTHHVVVVIEDLQWADAATFALLKTLASTLRGRHLTIIATYRSDDIDRFHPLHPVLAELDRTRGLVRVDLGPLSTLEVAEQVALLTAGGDVDGRDAETLAERSGGIPFLVEELVDLGDRGLPDTLRDLVLARYTRLTGDAQEAVRAMAAGGMQVDHDVLAAVSPLDERALDLALREAIDARVILADGAGYSFRHALTREAVEGEMLPSERVRVHRRYAEHLQENRVDSSDDASAIAEHWLAARDLPAAFDATTTALQRSRARFSPAMSAKLAERLTELWDQVPDAEARSGTTLARLHLDAALSWHDLGDSQRALRSANEGLAICVDEPITRAALLRQRFVQMFNSEYTGQREDLEAAVALLEGLEDPSARILLSRVLTNLALEEHGDEAAQHLARAIELAEEAGDNAALAVALTTEGWRLAEDEDDEEGALAPLERAAALKLNPPLRAYTAHAVVDMLVRLGRFEQATAIGSRGYDEVVRAGIERGSGPSIAHSLSFAFFASGRAEEGLQYARRARRLSDRASSASAVRLIVGHQMWNDEREARAEVLDVERGLIEEALRLKPSKGHWWAIDRTEALLTLTGADESDDAAVDDALTAVLGIVADEEATPALRRYALVTAALLLPPGGSARRPDRRAAIEASSGVEWPAHAAPQAWAAFLAALLADADAVPPRERVDLWSRAVEAIEGGIMPVWHREIGRSRLALALLDASERERAAAILEDVVDSAPAEGVAVVGRWARELAGDAGLSGGRLHDAAGGVIASLTPRELQVLELIAEGLTNAQIGQRLFISPKTASVHVSAILAKVGASNRAEAAALYTAALT